MRRGPPPAGRTCVKHRTLSTPGMAGACMFTVAYMAFSVLLLYFGCGGSDHLPDGDIGKYAVLWAGGRLEAVHQQSTTGLQPAAPPPQAGACVHHEGHGGGAEDDVEASRFEESLLNVLHRAAVDVEKGQAQRNRSSRSTSRSMAPYGASKPTFCTNSTLPRPEPAAFRRACSSMPSEISTPTTLPWGATSAAASSATMPVPVAMSRTCVTDRRSAFAINAAAS